jgi:uncharacterized protein
MAAENNFESIVKAGVGQIPLNFAPIRPTWVIDGNPITRTKVLTSSADGTATTVIWDCTAGRFNWFYEVDETIYVLEGGMVVRDWGGTPRRLCAGDTIFFPAGARAEWHVENYVRKIAFCRTPLPRHLVMAKKGLRYIRGLLGRGGNESAAPAMFQSQ